MTHDGKSLIVSDGSSTLYFWDPKTLSEVKRLSVTDRGQPVANLNELEIVEGEIYANVWQQDRIARVSPETGKVVGWIDLKGLLAPADRHGGEDVLNGIAYDAANKRLFVTGKLWPKLFEIEIVGK
jgi:glutaminyl-peptide cyclotransferase